MNYLFLKKHKLKIFINNNLHNYLLSLLLLLEVDSEPQLRKKEIIDKKNRELQILNKELILF